MTEKDYKIAKSLKKRLSKIVHISDFGKYDNSPIELLEKKIGVNIFFNPYGRKLTEKEITELLFNKDGLIAGTEPLTAKVLINAKKLKVISRCGTGMDNVDCEAAKKNNIKIFKTPESPAIAVAELTLGFILDALRGKTYMDRKIRNGKCCINLPCWLLCQRSKN